MTPKNRFIRFYLNMSDGTKMTVGDLPWPHRVLSARIVGDVVEVFDAIGTATFSLDDVRLSDLEIGR